MAIETLGGGPPPVRLEVANLLGVRLQVVLEAPITRNLAQAV
ncbi:hypothetical protein [Arthrobacter sp. RAF14]